MKTMHPLRGIETDNLLGFLMLLGLLRALNRERPAWFPRVHFYGVPLQAHLTTVDQVCEDDIAEVASAGCSAYAQNFIINGYSDLTFDGSTARRLMTEALEKDVVSAAVMSALCSDAAVRKDKRIEPTPLCAMFGQGHQSFLSRLHTVSEGILPKKLSEKKNVPSLTDPSIIKRALFSPWTRSDSTESFRWDFEEDRQYALRFGNPSSDAPTTEHGANRLAVLGLLSLQSAPTVRGGRVNLSTRGVSRSRGGGRPRITWPIWTRPASLEAIHSMLDHPELAKDEPSFALLRGYGIEQARRVNRIVRGKFISFSRAEALTGFMSETDGVSEMLRAVSKGRRSIKPPMSAK